MLGGYADGDKQSKLRANNLVTGGVETITGGDTSGAFGSAQARLGMTMPIGFFTLVPSVTAGFPYQRRSGYEEIGAGGLTVADYDVGVFTGQAELAARLSNFAQIRVGLDIRTNLSGPIDVSLATERIQVDSEHTTQIDPYVAVGARLPISNELGMHFDARLAKESWSIGAALAGTF
jgi:hypothetical protein